MLLVFSKMFEPRINMWNLAVWSTLLVLVKTKITCRFEDNELMFHSCNSTDNTDNILKRGLVSDKRKTFHIILNRCKISSIDLEAFYRLPALVILDLGENKIQQLELGIFDRIPLLSRLNLSHNLLTELPLGIFQHVPELSVLDLEGNQIKFLDPGIFDPIPRLDNLDLSYNFLEGKSLGIDFLRVNRGMPILTLSGNNMIEADFLSKMENLNYLFMNKCLLKEIPHFVIEANMKTLRHLSLSENEINTINNASILSNLINVEVLNLAKNNLEFIHEHTFKPLKSLEVLDLSHNHLSTIPVGMFQNIRLLRVLNLSFNILMDIPIKAFAETALKKLSLANNRFTYLNENFLIHLEDTGVMLKILQFGGNPWQCACLRDLLREVKELEVSYDADAFDGQHAVCVTKNEFVCKRDTTSSLEFIRMFK